MQKASRFVARVTLVALVLQLAGCGSRFTGAGTTNYLAPRRAAAGAPTPVRVTLQTVAIGRPSGLAYDKGGNLLVANNREGLLLAVSSQGVAMSRANNLVDPQAVATDRAGNVYVACSRDGSVVRVTDDTVHRIATGLTAPSAVAVLADGTVLVTQPATKEVLAIAADGTKQTVWHDATLVPEHLTVTGKDEIFLAVRAGQTGRILQIDRKGKQLDMYQFEHPVVGLQAGPKDKLLVAAAYRDDDDYLRGEVGWLDRDGTWNVNAEDVINPLALTVSPAGDPVFVQYDWDSNSYQVVTLVGDNVAPWLRGS